MSNVIVRFPFTLKSIYFLLLKATSMTIFLKAKLKKSNKQTIIGKYRVVVHKNLQKIVTGQKCYLLQDWKKESVIWMNIEYFAYCTWIIISKFMVIRQLFYVKKDAKIENNNAWRERTDFWSKLQSCNTVYIVPNCIGAYFKKKVFYLFGRRSRNRLCF